MKTTLRWLTLLVLAGAWQSPPARAADAGAPDASGSTQQDEQDRQFAALHWVKGPASEAIAGNSTLKVPEGFVYLDRADTKKFLELNHNLGDGQEVMIAPAEGEWTAYLEFDDGGYVKDDEKIDADALLKSLQQNTEAANDERKQRGWEPLHVTGWATPPAYNAATKRLEWATLLSSNGHENANFFTKILGRRGHTTVVLVSSTRQLPASEAQLDQVLEGYAFNAGETYAEWQPGDKVAEYGLAALILGGAAAVATKKGLWGVLAGFLAAAWKAIAAAVVGIGAWLRKRFARTTDAGS
ncbi:MAG: DUF2167 domain-containing protein [Proteobacteria bacterium]|nr:DUF2167 domain-containing protein [Pseudomonadota bacterium]